MTQAEEIARFLTPLRRILITSHERPDGDSIGSQLGAALALEQLGKTVEVVNRDPHPPNYRSLPGVERIRLGETVRGDFDCVLVLECGSFERTGVRGLDRFPAVNIDHHPVNDSYGILNWIDPSFAAVAQMVLPVLKLMGARITPEIASNLYTGILTDTGGFRFANTTPDALRAAAELVEFGANPATIAEEVLNRQSESRLRLLAGLLASLKRDPSGQLAWVTMEQRLFRESGAAPNDTEGLVNYPMSVEGVRACAIFREEPDGAWRISLRSKGDLDIGQVAQSFGGGGHRNAAGFSFPPAPVDRVTDEVLSRILPLLSEP